MKVIGIVLSRSSVTVFLSPNEEQIANTIQIASGGATARLPMVSEWISMKGMVVQRAVVVMATPSTMN